MVCMDVPTSEIIWPEKYIRKLRWRSEAKGASALRLDGADAASPASVESRARSSDGRGCDEEDGTGTSEIHSTPRRGEALA